MWVIVCFAFLFGVGTWTARLGGASRQYHQKNSNSRTLAEVFGEQAWKSESDVKLRRRNLEEFREGKVPDGLLPAQKDFLRDLDQDPKATPEYRKYRRKLIEDGEKLQLAPQEGNAVLFRKFAEHHGKLARKYDRARWHPWLPVEPDPPVP